MLKDHRKAKVTPELLEESRRLRAIWDRTPNRPSQAVFGETYDIGSQSAVTQFLNGSTPISLPAAIGFAKGLKCKISDFSPRLAAITSSMGPTTYPTAESTVREVREVAPSTVTALPVPSVAMALAVLSRAINVSPFKGTDALLGALTSFGKDPTNTTYLAALEMFLGGQSSGAAKTAKA